MLQAMYGLQNINQYAASDMESLLRRPKSSAPPLWQPQSLLKELQFITEATNRNVCKL